jgi:hypothetical protein
MRVRRVWCSTCLIRYTILPVFVAPAKWYSYIEIERALLFISWSEFRSITAGLKMWEIERQHRIENNLSTGPGASTVRFWWKNLDRAELERALTNISSGLALPSQDFSDSVTATLLPEDSWLGNLGVPVVQPPDPTPKPDVPQAKAMLHRFRTLGKALLVQWPATLAISLLAVGAWFVDGEMGRRCMGSPNLIGRVIPCRSPRSAATTFPHGAYPPETSPPP